MKVETVYVDSIKDVGESRVDVRNPETKRPETVISRKVCRVHLPKLGREGVAVNCIRFPQTGEVISVVVQYTDVPPGDVVGARCVVEKEQRQHHADEVVVIKDSNPKKEGK